MIRKLMKNDFLYMGRILGPIYLVMLGLSAIIGCFLRFGRVTGQSGDDTFSYTVFGASGLFAFALMLAAFVGGIVTLIMIIQGFYRNLLGVQGYLMFSLPVKSRTHVTAKILSSTFWVFLGGVCGILCLMLICVLGADMGQIGAGISSMNSNFTGQLSSADLTLCIIEAVVLVLLAIAAFIAKIYASIAVGHLWSEHRAAGAVLAFFGFNIIESIVMSVLHVGWAQISWIWPSRILTAGGMGNGLAVLLEICIGVFIIAFIYWLITSVILEKKLNLQ